VVRLGAPEVVTSAVGWHRRLAPLGVPLPALYDHGCEAPAFMLLERLPGTDLGNVHDTLGPRRLEDVAAGVADAQRRVATLAPFRGFGYARSADDPTLHASWAAVLEASLARSATRGDAAAVPSAAPARVSRLLADLRPALARVAPTPFLDDATTKNVIVDGGHLTGIVDVDVVCAGDPRLVVALTAVALLADGRPRLYADLLLHAMGGRRDAVLDLYEAVFCLDLLSEMGVTFNRPVPDPVDHARRER
jgi:hypothetical protein